MGRIKQSLKSKQYMVISGKELAAACKAKMAEQVKTFPEKYGRLPHLVVVPVSYTHLTLPTNSLV